jgi:hypothetical protein
MKNIFTILLILISISFFAQVQKGESIYKTIDFTNVTNPDFEKVEKFNGCIYAPTKTFYTTKAIAIGHVNPDPFIAFSCRWEEKEISPNNSNLQIRYSKDGVKWDAYKTIKIDEHNVGTNINYSTLEYLNKHIKFYQISISTNWNGKGNNLRSVTVNFFNPSKENGIIEQKTNEATKQLNPENCPCPLPTYVTRSQWNCPQGQGIAPGVVTNPAVTHLIVHHSDGPNTSTNWAAVVLSIWNYHTGTNGWSDIGYNWLVAPDGVLYEGRGSNSTNDNVQGAHFCGFNQATMGTCMIGTYTSVDITAPARTKLTEILAWKGCKANIPVIGTALHVSSGLNLNRISGHRDGCATDCPGTTFYNTLPQLRLDVDAKITSCNAVSNCTASLNIAVAGCPGNNVTFTPTVVLNGGTAPVFAWYVNNAFVQNGATFNLVNAANGTTVYARMTSNATCATVPIVNSDTVVLGCIITTAVATIDGLDYCTISPNPNDGNFVIKMNLTKSTTVQYRLVDALGKQIFITNKERLLSVVSKSFSNTTLAIGTYNLEIYFNGKRISKKIVVAK